MTKPNRRQFLASSIAAGAAILAREPKAATLAQRSFRQRSLSSFDRQASEVQRSMTLEEKIGQMTQAEQNALVDVSDIEDLFLGSDQRKQMLRLALRDRNPTNNAAPSQAVSRSDPGGRQNK